ncbi:hypothetical protein [Ruminococcus sp.]|uniref:hypothetical protein n=1 Tax=Ruminococcus sp. TaxID=41978 RepID=UPI001B514DC3|nr:hypothetical protein [Ruminococcus sp.]MBP5432996.1 hypothetical protein [Ruminococcus sp.]
MKILKLAITFSVAVIVSSCSRNVQETSVNLDKTTSTTPIVTEITVENTTISITTEKESTTAIETTTVIYSNSYEGLSGYWYIDGDPSAASFHITKDGKFTAYYANGLVENEGIVRRVLDPAINNYIYCMYLESGKLYYKFADDGEKEKTDIYMGNNGTTHYIKLYGEGGLGDDGLDPEEAYTGTWNCERAHIDITYYGEGIFHATVKWGASASTYAQWEYPLIFENDKLICNGNGTRSFVEYKDAESEPTVTVDYTDGSAEFTLEGNRLFWNNLTEHNADDMIFSKESY